MDALRGLPTMFGELFVFLGDRVEEEVGLDSTEIVDNEEVDCGRGGKGGGDNVVDNGTVTVSGASARPIFHNNFLLVSADNNVRLAS